MAKAKGSNVPAWVWIFTPLVVCSFIAFLFYLSTLPSGKAPVEALKEAGEELKKSKPAVVDDYEFYRLLEQKEVHSPDVATYKSTPKKAPAASTTTSSAAVQKFRLQAGSFRNVADADRLKANLTLNGLNVQVESAEIRGEPWFRVFVGPFTDRSKMNAAQDALAGMSIQSIVVKQP
ncbi:MAG: SPOR domain-containing protein [Oceanospirillaceae bacterium]|nr:SPOR domain-containing protein [Oceanospirillaceae bacterium]MCP5351153.1 SPOR domain-containing protein [Oceanospirillaceae bacterium]